MTRLADIPFEATRAPEPPAPPLAALWRGEARRWWRFHVVDRAVGWSQLALLQVMRPLPPEAAAAVGRGLGALTGRLEDGRPFVGHMRRAIGKIRPDLDEAGREALLRRWWREAGTTQAQWPVLDRMAAPGRLTIHGEARLDEAADDPRPTIFLLVHLGNWELLGRMFARHRRPAFGIWEPQPNRYQNRMIQAERVARGLHVFPPSRGLPKLMMSLIRDGCNPTFFIDEVSEGRCKFPLWGGPLPTHCNLVLLLRMAHITGARVQPAHFLRDAPGRASYHLLAPIEPRPDLTREAWVETAARALSAQFEPVIAANLAQWYMLKDMRVPARPSRG